MCFSFKAAALRAMTAFFVSLNTGGLPPQLPLPRSLLGNRAGSPTFASSYPNDGGNGCLVGDPSKRKRSAIHASRDAPSCSERTPKMLSGGPNSLISRVVFLRFGRSRHIGCLAAPDGPKGLLEFPKTAQEGPKTVQACPQDSLDSLRWTQRRPRWPPRRPGWPYMVSKTIQDALQEIEDGP